MNHGPTETDDGVESLLAAATAGPAVSASLWRKALERDEAGRATQRSRPSLLKVRVPLAVAASILLMLVVVGALMPSLGKARSSSRVSDSRWAESDGGSEMDRRPISAAAAPSSSEGYLLSPGTGGGPMMASASGSLRTTQTQQSATGSLSPVLAAERHVIRKVTIDLTAPDVRSTFAKTALVINEALGEYVETSSVMGEGEAASATMTLRVAAGRVSEVMNQLRGLGVVVSETTNGQDVTDTVVDLEARIRNEERVERELLVLMDKRPDSPLADVLEIRTQLANVRGQIESLVGQRERIGRLVALATVLVTIRAENVVPVEVQPDGIGAYFVAGVGQAWESSLRALADTAAFLIRVFVGGIVWWVVAGFAAAVVWKMARRVFESGSREPAPLG